MPAITDDIASQLMHTVSTAVEKLDNLCDASEEIKKGLATINGRVRENEQRVATLWERVEGHHAIIKLTAGVVGTVLGGLIIAGIVKIASLF